MKRPKSALYTTISQSQSQSQSRTDQDQDDDDDIETLPMHHSHHSHSSNDHNHTATIKSLNIDNLTSKSARNQTLFTITQVGTQSSRNGLYVRPSWKKTLKDHFRNTEKLKIWAILLIMLLSLRPLHKFFIATNNTDADKDASGNFPTNSLDQDDDLISIPNENFKTLSTSKAMKNINHMCRTDHLDNHISSTSHSHSSECDCLNPMEPVVGSLEGWMGAYEANLSLVRSKVQQNQQVDVVFLGDSITEEWNGRWLGKRQGRYTSMFEETHNVWKDLFDSGGSTAHGTGAMNGLALGIAGDRIANLLWRIQNGELDDNLDSKVFWVLIGTNDLKSGCSEDVILLGIIHVAEEIRKLRPDSIVVLNGILPRTNRADGRLTFGSNDVDNYADAGAGAVHYGGDEYSMLNNMTMATETATEAPVTSTGRNTSSHNYTYWQSIQGINKGLARYAELNDNVEYFDASDIFIAQMGNKVYQREEKFLVKELQQDYVHPTPLGHKLWGEAIVDYIVSDLDTPKNLRKGYAD
jgi:lysophospholipase L1-like esterase